MADLFRQVGVEFVSKGEKQLITNLNSVGSATDKATASMTGQAKANQFASRKINEVGMATQQAGYQIGDFLVQIQGGTNAFVAFGQQATQLVGILPMFASKLNMSVGTLISISAGLGIAIPLATALGAMFMRAGGGALTFEDRVKELDTALENLAKANDMATMSTEELRDSYGGASDALRSTLDLLSEIARSEAQDKIDGLAEAMSDLYGIRGAGERRTALADLFDANIFLAFTDAQRESREQARALTYEFVRQQDILATSKGDLDAQIAATESLLNVTKILADFNGEVSDEERDLLKLLAERLLSMQEIKSTMGDTADITADMREHQEGVNKLLEAGRQAQIDRNRTGRETIIDMENQIRLAETIRDYGKDSVEVVRLKAQQEAISRNLNTENAEKYVEMALQLHNIESGMEGSANSAKTLSDALREASSAMSSLVGFSANLDRALAVSAAKVEALRSGADAAVAGQIAGMRVDLDRRMQDAISSGVDRSIVESMFGGERGRISDLAASEAERVRLQNTGRTAPTGGGSSARPTITEDEYLAQLRQEVDQKRTLSTLSQEQRSIEERVIQLQEQAQAQQLTISNERLRMFAMEEQRIADQMRLQDIFSNNIESALMSVVDGTKSVEDAFKGMLRTIILEIYKQQVASPIAQGAGSFLSSLLFANGGAFNRGNVIPFANGGVVGSPTTFPMANGNTGLMGEAGPEAIMPLKRGKDGKLGVVSEGGGAVTVNNYFTVQANGDDSVKRIVRQQIPQIAEATKAAVVDSKRRGGSYGRAFG